MKILITTPFFSNLGGSELETIFTANYYASLSNVSLVIVYVEAGFDLTFTEKVFIDAKISIKRKPFFFNKRLVKKINRRIKRDLNLSFYPFENIYWFFHFLRKRYANIYIISKSSLQYYVPIIRFSRKKDNIVVKYTTITFNDIPEHTKFYLRKVKDNITTSESQQQFFKGVLGIENTIAMEPLIYDEFDNVTETVSELEKYDFGSLSRISREKQIEESILLIKKLNELGYRKTLLIRGGGIDEEYKLELEKLIKDYELESQITFIYKSVAYDEVYTFYHTVKIVLITSLFEGGPTVGLEAMAYGLPIISFDVGAMKDRLSDFSNLIAKDRSDFVEIAISLVSLNEKEYQHLCKKIKTRYKTKYGNAKVENYLKQLV